MKEQGFKHMESAWDCCWVAWYNIAFVMISILTTILLIITDIIIVIGLIIPYDILYGITYSLIRCATCGRFQQLKSCFIKIKCDLDTLEDTNKN